MQPGVIGLGRGVRIGPPRLRAPGDFDVVSDTTLDFTLEDGNLTRVAGFHRFKSMAAIM